MGVFSVPLHVIAAHDVDLLVSDAAFSSAILICIGCPDRR